MSRDDPFDDLARYYDGIMAYVDYERWFTVTSSLTKLLPKAATHLDAACGTGILVRMLRRAGLSSLGVDISYAMVREGRKKENSLPAAVADIRALPFCEGADLLTCLFDSLNFLLDETDVRTALLQFGQALRPQGVLYFDIVTELMVTEHFEDQTWTEDNDGFKTTWSSRYDHEQALTDTLVRINQGVESLIRERIYSVDFIEEAVHDAGLTLLAVFDANTWKPPGRRATRIDFVAVKQPARAQQRAFRKVCASVRRRIEA